MQGDALENLGFRLFDVAARPVILHAGVDEGFYALGILRIEGAGGQCHGEGEKGGGCGKDETFHGRFLQRAVGTGAG
jgi:hypothetical protein